MALTAKLEPDLIEVATPPIPEDFPRLQKIQCWEQSPVLSPTVFSGSEEDLRQAYEIYKEIVGPIVRPEDYPEMAARFSRRKDLLCCLAKEHQTSKSAIYRYLNAFNDGGIPALARRIRRDKGQRKALDKAGQAAFWEIVLTNRATCGKMSIRESCRAYNEERLWRASKIGQALTPEEAKTYGRGGYVGADSTLLPSCRLSAVSDETLRREFYKIPEVLRLMGREGKEAYRDRELISRRDLTVLRPLQYIVMDHRVLDIFCLIPETGGGYKLGRPWLTAAIDMRTRKWLAWVIVEVPSSDSIAACLRRSILDFGAPENIYIDNGKDFRCQWFEGRRVRSEGGAVGPIGGSWPGVFATLGINVIHAIVENARAKIVEPNFGRVSKFDETLPEFCGHKPTQRPEAFESRMRRHKQWEEGKSQERVFRTIGEVTDLYSKVMNDLNERPLEGDGMRKVTPTGRGWWCPNEAWEILAGSIPRRTIPEDVLQFCFAKRKEVTVSNGEVPSIVGGNKYRYRIAANKAGLLMLNGCKVELAYDPLDLETCALFHEQKFVGMVSCIELRRMGESAFIEDEKIRRHYRREARAFIKALHSSVPVAGTLERLDRRAAVAPQRFDPKRVEVPFSLPAEIAEAHAAMSADKNFSFAANEGAAIVAVAPSPPANDDDRFCFFSSDREALNA